MHWRSRWLPYWQVRPQKNHPFSLQRTRQRAQKWFRKYGGALLLTSPWIPFAGDLVSLVAGMENYDAPRFVIIISAAKIIKGTALVYSISFFLQFSGLHF
ncbi:MAG TPA: VTT domain-containing protein [archaeon]